MYLRYTLFLLVLALSAVLGACSTEPNEAAETQAARAALSSGDLPTATVHLKNALSANPESANARFMLAELLTREGQFAVAESELRRALANGQPKEDVLPILAHCLVEQGKHKIAFDELGAVTLATPNATARLKVTLGAGLGRSGDAKGARALLDAAAALDKAEPTVRMLRIRLDAGAGMLDQAKAEMAALAQERPNDVDVRLLEGDIALRLLGAADAALAAYSKAVELRKDRIEGHAGVITALQMLGRTDDAVAHTDELSKLIPAHPETKFFVAQALFLRGDYPAAAEQTQRLLLQAPGSISLLRLAGAIHLKLGNLARAEGYFSKALANAPGNSTIRGLLAHTYLRMAAPNRALEILRGAVSDPSANVVTLAQAAEAYLQLGDTAKAENLFQRAAKLRPDDIGIQTARAIGQLAKGERDAGLKAMQDIASADPGTYADKALISQLMRGRDIDATLKAIDALSKKEPQSSLPKLLRGQALMKSGDLAGARTALQGALAKDPTNLTPKLMLCDIDVRTGQFDTGARCFSAILAENPTSWPASAGLIRSRRLLGADEATIRSLLTEAVSNSPQQLAPQLALINHLSGRREFKAAVAAAENAATKIPDSPELLLTYARALARNGDLNQAVSMYNKVSTLQPKAVEPYLGVAEAYMLAKNSKDAEYQLRKALTIDPLHAAPRQMLAEIALRENNPEKALLVARDAQKTQPKRATGYLLEGSIQLQLKRPESALAPLRIATELQEPGAAAMRYHFALGAARKQPQAKEFAERWLSLHPNDNVFKFYLGSSALAAGKYDSAEVLFREVTVSDDGNALAWNNLAWLRLKQGKPDALPPAAKAASLAPTEATVLDTLAQAQLAAGQPEAALVSSGTAVHLAPDAPVLKLTLAKAYIKSGKSELAKPLIDELTKLGPSLGADKELAELRSGL